MRKHILQAVLLMTLGISVPNMVSAQRYSLYVGEQEFLEIPDPPYNGYLSTASWDRGEHIAFAEKCELYAIAYPIHYFEGTETVSCSYSYTYVVAGKTKVGRSSATYYITCKPVDGKLSENQLNMKIGEKKKLTYRPSYSAYTSFTSQYVKWTSSNENVVTVDKDGNVEAKSSGEALITFDPVGGPLLYCNVTVERIYPTKISIKEDKVSVVEGKTKSLSYELQPQGASATVKWTSSDKSVVEVTSTGRITGVSEGSATITATTDNNLSAFCIVKVVSAPKSVSLPEETEVFQGYNVRLTPVLTPVETETTFKWASEDTSIAIVNSNGVVTGSSVGTTNISATTDNGLVAKCRIVVKEAPQGADSQSAKTRIKIVKDLMEETFKYIEK